MSVNPRIDISNAAPADVTINKKVDNLLPLPGISGLALNYSLFILKSTVRLGMESYLRLRDCDNVAIVAYHHFQ